jgi:hypothetical protein
MVESLADDAQFVTVNGAWTTTRADYLNLMQRLQSGPFRTSTRETPIMHVRFLAPDVAMMHSQFHIYGDLKNLCALALVRESCARSVVGGP